MIQTRPPTVDADWSAQFPPLKSWLRIPVLSASVSIIGFGAGVLGAFVYDVTGGGDQAQARTVTGIGLGVGAVLGLVFGLLWRGTWWQASRARKHAERTSQWLAASAAVTPPPIPPVNPERQASAWPTVLATMMLTPVIGWIPALVQGRRAKSRGLDEAYYWKAFAATVVVSVSLGLTVRALTGR